MRKRLSPSKKRRSISTESKVKKPKILKIINQNECLEENIFKLKVNTIIIYN